VYIPRPLIYSQYTGILYTAVGMSAFRYIPPFSKRQQRTVDDKSICKLHIGGKVNLLNLQLSLPIPSWCIPEHCAPRRFIPEWSVFWQRRSGIQHHVPQFINKGWTYWYLKKHSIVSRFYDNCDSPLLFWCFNVKNTSDVVIYRYNGIILHTTD
jgi:hypothetical protein